MKFKNTLYNVVSFIKDLILFPYYDIKFMNAQDKLLSYAIDVYELSSDKFIEKHFGLSVDVINVLPKKHFDFYCKYSKLNDFKKPFDVSKEGDELKYPLIDRNLVKKFYSFFPLEKGKTKNILLGKMNISVNSLDNLLEKLSYDKIIPFKQVI